MRKQFPGPLNVSWAQVSLLSVSDRQVSPEDIFFGHRSWGDDLKSVHNEATLTFRQSHKFSMLTLNSLNNRGWHQSTVTPVSTSRCWKSLMAKATVPGFLQCWRSEWELCECLGSIAPTELQPQHNQFWNGVCPESDYTLWTSEAISLFWGL